jgi:type II secretory pathway pseudopilin PulG
VELLVLILVLALAASIAIPLFWQDRKALAAAVQGDLASLANDLLISYWSDHSDPPTTVKVKTDGPDGRPYVAIEADGDTYNSITLSHALNPDTLRLDFGADYRDWCASAAPKGSDQRWHVVPPPNAKKGHIYSVRPEDVEPGDCG